MPKSGSPNNPDQQPDRRGTREDNVKPPNSKPRQIPPPFKTGGKK